MIWLAGVVVTLAWGAGAFGSNYPWAYTPLMIASALLGLAGLGLGRSRISMPHPLSLGLVVVAIAVQLVPLPEGGLAAWSPNALSLIRQRDLALSVAETITHPLSIEPRQTWLGLAFLASFGALLFGTARILTREDARWLAGTIVILGAVLATVGIVQRATFTGKIYGFWELIQGGAVFGPFVNKNHFAGWMLMGIPVVVAPLGK